MRSRRSEAIEVTLMRKGDCLDKGNGTEGVRGALEESIWNICWWI